ncbi:MAG: ribbon-helix-helix protein, CopG family [Anaerolineae bacterium]|jgi:predicted DNA-binding protein|nr:ribbon-helix-helix protein, CopG family [Anaerolineae bacterium]
MPNTGRFTKHLQLYVEPEMYQFLKILAERQNVTMNEVIREAIRRYVDAQEDVMNSRSRLGAGVIRRLEDVQRRLLAQGAYQARLQLAAMVILLTEQGLDAPGTLARIVELAEHPKIIKAVEKP